MFSAVISAEKRLNALGYAVKYRQNHEEKVGYNAVSGDSGISLKLEKNRVKQNDQQSGGELCSQGRKTTGKNFSCALERKGKFRQMKMIFLLPEKGKKKET